MGGVKNDDGCRSHLSRFGEHTTTQSGRTAVSKVQLTASGHDAGLCEQLISSWGSLQRCMVVYMLNEGPCRHSSSGSAWDAGGS